MSTAVVFFHIGLYPVLSTGGHEKVRRDPRMTANSPTFCTNNKGRHATFNKYVVPGMSRFDEDRRTVGMLNPVRDENESMCRGEKRHL